MSTEKILMNVYILDLLFIVHLVMLHHSYQYIIWKIYKYRPCLKVKNEVVVLLLPYIFHVAVAALGNTVQTRTYYYSYKYFGFSFQFVM